MAAPPATRRFLLSGALRTLPRATTAKTPCPAVSRPARSLVSLARPATTSFSCHNPVPAKGVRWSTTSATGSKIWSFEEIKDLQDPKITIVDVREPGELKQTGHIPNAVNIPITTYPDSFHITPEDFEDRFGFTRPGPEDEMVFYCKAGVRSRAAAGIAKEAGWKNVGEYPGSWVEWSGKGGAIEH
ncbi:Rhodanese-like domain-containing protein [Xylariaceae sp. FL1272]|nr:Rhodanese-like domain-containing protein [Xylariaceae sp. FL1272]